MRDITAQISTKFAGKRVTTDDLSSPTSPRPRPVNTVSLGEIEQFAIARALVYRSWGIIENIPALVENMEVSKASPTRVDLLFPPDMANPLLQTVTVLQPRLDY
jgi:hypothetical protein